MAPLETEFWDISQYQFLAITTITTSLRQLWQQQLQLRYAQVQRKLQQDQQQRHPHEVACTLNKPDALWQTLADPQQHLAHAIALFEQGAFIVLVDEQQIGDVDQSFQLNKYSNIQMIRLIQLTGKIKK